MVCLSSILADFRPAVMSLKSDRSCAPFWLKNLPGFIDYRKVVGKDERVAVVHVRLWLTGSNQQLIFHQEISWRNGLDKIDQFFDPDKQLR